MSDQSSEIDAAVAQLRRRVKLWPADKPVIHCTSPQVAVELIVALCNFRYEHASIRRLWQQRRLHRGDELSYDEYLSRAGFDNLRNIWQFLPRRIGDNLRVTNGDISAHISLEAQGNTVNEQRAMADLSFDRPFKGHTRLTTPENNEVRLVKNAEMLLQRSFGFDRNMTTSQFTGRVPASVNYAFQHKMFGDASMYADLHFCTNGIREHFVQRLGMAWLFKQLSIVVDPPVEVHTDDQGRLHHDTNLAARWADGTGLTAINGVYVEEWKLLNPDAVPPEEVLRENNAEIRRVLIERIGYERLVQSANAHKVSDDEVGTLWHIHARHPVRVVEVVNSSAEPDGTYKRYFLRVPPSVSTPRQAVAWTFGLSDRDYAPEVQT